MNKIEVLGCDDGFDYIKMVAGKGNRLIYPSIYKPYEEVNLGAGFESSSFSEDNMVLEFEDEIYEIGSKAIESDYSGTKAVKSLRDDKFTEVPEQAKVLAGIGILAGNEDTEIDLLVHGLSISSFNQYKRDKDKVYTGKFQYRAGGKTVTIKINNATCVAQGQGAFWDEYLDYKGSQKKETPEGYVGIVDIGGKTVDFFLVRDTETIGSTAGSLDNGMHKVFSQIAEDNKLPVNKVEYAIWRDKDTVYDDGNHINIKEKMDQYVEKLAQSIYTKISTTWGEGLRSVEKIFVCGGGAELISPHLDNLFKSEISMFENPQFGNAEGYYKLGNIRMQANKTKESKEE